MFSGPHSPFLRLPPEAGPSIKPEKCVYRLWKSKAGTSVDARLKSVHNRLAKLERVDGSIIDVPIEALQEVDQLYIMDATVAKVSFDKGVPLTDSRGGVVKIPENFPVDPLIGKDPFLKKQRSQPLNFTFKDIVSGKTVSAFQFKGRVLYLHSSCYASDQSREIKVLKALRDKYASRGFDIISVEANSGRKLKGDGEERYTEKAKRLRIQNYIDEHALDWAIAFPAAGCVNPVIEKVSNSGNFSCLFGPDGRLLHTHIFVRPPNESTKSFVLLADLLKVIFPD